VSLGLVVHDILHSVEVQSSVSEGTLLIVQSNPSIVTESAWLI
jgi:hypothetical protein